MSKRAVGDQTAAPGMLIDPNDAAKVRRLRTAAWATLPLLVLVYGALLSAPIPHFTRLVLLELIYCTPITLTVVLSLRARALSEAGERTFWGALALANGALLLCEVLLVYWVGVLDPAGPPRVSWPFHVLHAVAAGSFLVALAAMSRLSEASPAALGRWLVDVMASSLAIGLLVLYFYTVPVMMPAGATIGELLLGTSYVVFGLLMVTGTVFNVVGFKVERWRSWDKLFAISLSIYAIPVCLWPVWFTTAATTSRNYERGVLDLVQLAGHWLLMSAALYRLTEIPDWKLRPLPPLDLARRPWLLAISPAASLMGVPLLVALAVRTWPDKQWVGLAVAGLAILATLAVVRGVLVSLENGLLFHRSVTDPLTGLYNRRFFHGRLNDEVERARRYAYPLSVVALDVDRYAEVSERLGHADADRLLRQIGSELLDRCERQCIVFRTGTDEFAVIAPETGLIDATVLARRLIDAISIGVGPSPGEVTASAGVATMPDHADSAEGLLQIAQGALFHAKTSGSDGVVVFDVDQVPDLNVGDRISRLERQTRLSSINALSAVMGAQDEGLEHHARALASLARQVAEDLELGEGQIERIEEGALLHDIGLLVEPVADAAEAAATAPDAAPASQRAAGQRIIASSGLTDVLPAVRSIAEFWDGTGQPEGLMGEEIPIEARVLSACHAYLGMVTGTHGGQNRFRALARLEDEAGRRYDPQVIESLRCVVVSETPLA